MKADAVFDVKAMGFPPVEPKEDVLRTLKVPIFISKFELGQTKS